MSTKLPKEITTALDRFDAADLVSSLAALQILPQNAERGIRLELLANIAVTLPIEGSKPLIPASKLRGICNSPLLDDISSLEDPSEEAFTEALTFIGGSYVVFPGLVENGTFIVRHLIEAILQHPEPFPSRAFTNLAVRLIGAALTVSDLVAQRAGLSRYVSPASEDRDVYVPNRHRLRRVKDTVRFGADELHQAILARGFSPSALEPLIVEQGVSSLADCSPQTGPLQSRPLVRCGDSIILASPGLMLAALRHGLICLAEECGVLGILAKRYRDVLWLSTMRALEHLGHDPLNIPLPTLPDDEPILDGAFRIDADKILYVSLVTDDLRGYSRTQVFGDWEFENLTELLEGRQRAVEDYIFSVSSGLNEILVLYLITGVGRTGSGGFGEPLAPLRAPRIVMDVPDLEVLALLEGESPLMLWKYAIASTRIRDTTKILAFSQLDEFYHYREHRYSYYLTDDAPSNLISFSSGSGLELRLDVAREFDLHGVPAFRPGHVIEVARRDREFDMPVYVALSLVSSGQQAALLVEGLPVCVWIVGPDYTEEPDQREIHHIYFQMVDMIAYWLWQFTPSLSRFLEPLAQTSSTLVISLQADPRMDWFGGSGSGASEESQLGLTYEILRPEQTIILHIDPVFQNRLRSPDNRGERLCMALVLEALNGLISPAGTGGQLTPECIQHILDRHAPLGKQKKLIILDPEINPALSATGLAPHRPVQAADKSVWLDRLGDYLAAKYGLPEGPIPSSDGVGVLRSVVGFLYHELQRLVATLSPAGLLDWLVQYHEAVVLDASRLRLTMPTRVACFGKEVEESIGKELQGLYEAGQAARFAIEYVAARPPSGLRPMSLSVYDELQALASQIIYWAETSDMIHFRIADIELSMLPSGRLGSDRDAVDQAVKSFIPLHTVERMDQAQSSFDRHWQQTPTSGRSVSEIDEIDGAYEAEFGYTLSERVTLMDDLFALGQGQDAPVKRLTADEAVGQLSDSLGLSGTKVAHMLQDISLESRADFLNPPAPFRTEDVYPWRFSRPLSYLSRPLLKTTEDGRTVLVWGNVHLRQSMNYTVDLCLSGRLQSRAQSQEMRSLLARFQKEKGRAFNDRVTGAFTCHEDLIVRSNIRKIGEVRMAKDGQDLGDIDLLVISPRRRKILVVECKDLSVARNPHEMANELQELFIGTDDKTPTVVRHQRRVDWVENNLNVVLEHYGVSPRGKWRVESILVISDEMFTPHLYPSPIPVVSYVRLEQQFVPEWL